MTSNTKLAFHPDAADSFRDRGERLFAALKPLERPKPDERFTADRHPVGTFTKEDLPTLLLQETVDRLTMETTEIAFLQEHQGLVLEGDDCREVAALTEAVQGTSDFKPRVSRTFVRRTILRWLEEKIEVETEYDLPTYILEKATDALEVFEVWVPIASLAVERAVRLDAVHVRPLSKEILDCWFANWKAGKPAADQALLDEAFEELRGRIQGLAASVITVRAEGQFAVQKGLEKAEDVAAIFRLLHPANSHPQAVFYCRPLGRENVETHLVLLAERDILKRRIEATSPPMPDMWELSGEQLNALERDFTPLRSLLQIGNRSKFSKAALDAILLYSRSTMASPENSRYARKALWDGRITGAGRRQGW